MIFNKVITDMYLMNNPKIELKYNQYDSIDLRVDNIFMGTIVCSDNSVFYKDFITEENRDIKRRDYFLSKVTHERILRLKDPYSIYSGHMINIYKITGVKNE